MNVAPLASSITSPGVGAVERGLQIAAGGDADAGRAVAVAGVDISTVAGKRLGGNAEEQREGDRFHDVRMPERSGDGAGTVKTAAEAASSLCGRFGGGTPSADHTPQRCPESLITPARRTAAASQMSAVPTRTIAASSRIAGSARLTRCTATVGAAFTDGSSLADAGAPDAVASDRQTGECQ